jgi:membrane associated rhomboid family serine protease
MQVDSYDPVQASTARDRANLRLALALTLGFVALLWLFQLLNWALDLPPVAIGIRPRTLAGLPGILLAPLQHADFAHLLANTVPLVVLGTTMLYLYPASALRVLPAVYVVPGAAVWLLARGSVHVGASGLVYGLFAYVFTAGVIRRDRRAIAAALLVCFLYGALVWGVLPIEPGISWETHLAGAVVGLALAPALRNLDLPRRSEPTEAGEDGDTRGAGGDPAAGP